MQIDRTIPYEPETVCDMCGEKGAFDFMGDFLCPECTQEALDGSESYEAKKERGGEG